MSVFKLYLILMISVLFISVSGGCTPKEKCDNAIDDDGNGVMDCADPACINASNCTEVCNNGVDDNRDSKTDCEDIRCADSVYCRPEICDNGVDDNQDGYTDCLDSTCRYLPVCQENCSNGVDDDMDGDTDCYDHDCAGSPSCVEDCYNGTDDDGDYDIDCDDSDCRNLNYCSLGCSLETSYWDSPQDTCPPGEGCGEILSGSDTIFACKDEAMFGSGGWFSSCSTGNCPFGAVCVDLFGCMPICDGDESSDEHNCPAGTLSYYYTTMGGEYVYLCSESGCNPVTQDCGDAGMMCVTYSYDDSVCVERGADHPVGAGCNYDRDCAPSLICVSNVCYATCTIGGSDCDSSQYCYHFYVDDHNSTEWGYCAE